MVDRQAVPDQDQRQHRQLGRDLVDRRGGREAHLGGEVGRRHGDGPLDRQADPRDARGDRAPFDGADRHRADLPGAREGKGQGRRALDRGLHGDPRASSASRGSTTSPSTPACGCSYIPLTAKRVTGIVSRGGSILAKWCLAHHRENFLYTHFEEICDADAAATTSRSRSATACGRARSPTPTTRRSSPSSTPWASSPRSPGDHDCQVMVEGPGHVPMHLVKENVDRQQRDLQGGAVLHPGAAGHRHRSRLRPHHLARSAPR